MEQNQPLNNDTLKQAKDELEAVCKKYDIALTRHLLLIVKQDGKL